jgi:hypothetical protein
VDLEAFDASASDLVRSSDRNKKVAAFAVVQRRRPSAAYALSAPPHDYDPSR